MIDLDTLPQETGLMTMQNYVLPATDDEIYVTPSDALPDGPILPARIGPAREPAGPAVRPRVLDTFLTWLATHEPTVSALLSWQGTTLVLADTDEQRPPHHITPGPDGRYSLAAWPWYLCGPEHPKRDRDTISDPARYEPLPGEEFVRPCLDSPHDTPYNTPAPVAPSFPALCTPSNNNRLVPRFRRPVAEAMAAWTNIHRRIWNFEGDLAYWHNHTLVLVDIGWCEFPECHHHPRIATPDEHGRYQLPATSWSYTPTPPNSHTIPA